MLFVRYALRPKTQLSIENPSVLDISIMRDCEHLARIQTNPTVCGETVSVSRKVLVNLTCENKNKAKCTMP